MQAAAVRITALEEELKSARGIIHSLDCNALYVMADLAKTYRPGIREFMSRTDGMFERPVPAKEVP